MPSQAIGVRRLSHPSGPWVDAQGNPARSPNSDTHSYVEPTHTVKPKAYPRLEGKNMPDPNDWKVVKAAEMNGFLILKLNYPNCTHYEGNKILVFQGSTLIDLVNQRMIDPHFFKDSKYKSPVARFEPTDNGWRMAEIFTAAWATAKSTGKV